MKLIPIIPLWDVVNVTGGHIPIVKIQLNNYLSWVDGFTGNAPVALSQIYAAQNFLNQILKFQMISLFSSLKIR